MDSVLAQAREGAVQVIGGDRDVTIAGTDLVAVHAGVECQLEARTVAGHSHEYVRRAVREVRPPDLLEAEGAVEANRSIDVGYPVAGVDERHQLKLDDRPGALRPAIGPVGR